MVFTVGTWVLGWFKPQPRLHTFEPQPPAPAASGLFVVRTPQYEPFSILSWRSAGSTACRHSLSSRAHGGRFTCGSRTTSNSYIPRVPSSAFPETGNETLPSAQANRSPTEDVPRRLVQPDREPDAGQMLAIRLTRVSLTLKAGTPPAPSSMKEVSGRSFKSDSYPLRPMRASPIRVPLLGQHESG